jgi:hypothetical protein
MGAILIVRVVGFLTGGNCSAKTVEPRAKVGYGGGGGKGGKVGGHLERSETWFWVMKVYTYLPRRLSRVGGALVARGVRLSAHFNASEIAEGISGVGLYEGNYRPSDGSYTVRMVEKRNVVFRVLMEGEKGGKMSQVGGSCIPE